jgi:hypothetical protein
LKRVPAALGISAVLAVGAGVVAGASPKHCACDRCTVDGVCTPNVYHYGYYQTQWRTWPKTSVTNASDRRGGVKLPTQVEPPATQEDTDIAPKPGENGETESPGMPPVKRAIGDDAENGTPKPTGGEQPVPRTDKPDPFRDDPEQNATDEREMSVLIPPANIEHEQIAADDGRETAQLEHAVRSMLSEVPPAEELPDALPGHAATEEVPADVDLPPAPLANREVPHAGASAKVAVLETAIDESKQDSRDDRPLRLVDAEGKTPTQVKPAAAVAPVAPAEGGNPLRSGWGARSAATRKATDRPPVVTKFSEAANPLRR